MSWLNSLKLRLGLYLAWSCALTWPLARHLFTAYPVGLVSERSSSVPQLNMWTIWWNADRVLHGFQNYWQAPIFHSYPDAFALSEPQPITMLLAPLVWLFPASAAPYNIYLIGSLALNALLADLVLRHLKVSPLVAVYGGLMAAALPFVHWQRDVIQLIPIWGVLWFWLSLSRFAEQMTIRRALVVGLAFSSVVLSCLHHALFLVMLSCIACWWLVYDRLLDRRFWLGMLAAGGLAAVICGPFVVPQIMTLSAGKWDRDPATVESLSALPVDYLWVWYPLWHKQPPIYRPGDQLPWAMSPGWMVLALAAIAVIVQLVRWYRERRTLPFAEIIEDDSPTPAPPSSEPPAMLSSGIPQSAADIVPRHPGAWVRMFVTIAAVALTLSCGAHLKWGDVDVHAFFVKYIPGYRQLRSPFRFGLFFQLVTTLLAVLAIEALWKWGKRAIRRDVTGDSRPTAWKLWTQIGSLLVMTAAMGLSLCELHWHPVPLYRIPTVCGPKDRLQPLWVDWLIEHSEESDVIAHLPFPQGTTVWDYEPTTDAMFWQMRHRRTMVNGYSGFFPKSFGEVQTACWTFPSADSLAALKNFDVRWCIVSRSVYATSYAQPMSAVGLKHMFFDEPNGVDVYLVE